MRDLVSASTHFIASLISCVVAFGIYREARRHRLTLIPIMIFPFSMIFCYSASALYHAVTLSEPVVAALQLLDHTGVYILIAGTDSPIIFFLLKPGRFRRYLLWTAWTLAFVGIMSTWFLHGLPYWAIVLPYIALGWVGIIPFPILLRAVRWRKASWLLAGGIFYTLGALIDWLGVQRVDGQAFGAHEVFHILTMVGTACHVVFIWRFVILYSAENLRGASSPAPVSEYQ